MSPKGGIRKRIVAKLEMLHATEHPGSKSRAGVPRHEPEVFGVGWRRAPKPAVESLRRSLSGKVSSEIGAKGN